MTEAEWLNANDPVPMLEYLRDIASERKFRQFAFSAIWPLLASWGDSQTQEFANVVAQAAEATFNHRELRDARRQVSIFSFPTVPALSPAEYVTGALGLVLDADPLRAATSMVSAVVHLERHLPAKPSISETTHYWDLACTPSDSRSRLCSHIHCVFGSPFVSAGIKPEWRTETATILARTMYESRDFSAMPILADALQDAGCDNEDILSHCREPNAIHVRGCWVVDYVLGFA